jgi:hypothetical protein
MGCEPRSRITLTRLAELLNLDSAATEKALAEMVVSKTVKPRPSIEWTLFTP